MTVSLVGRMAMGRSRSVWPDLVTQATCTASHNQAPAEQALQSRGRIEGDAAMLAVGSIHQSKAATVQRK